MATFIYTYIAVCVHVYELSHHACMCASEPICVVQTYTATITMKVMATTMRTAISTASIHIKGEL